MMKAASKASKQAKVTNCVYDKTFTPRAAATASMQIIDIETTDHCLDPARGGGAFYDQFACYEQQFLPLRYEVKLKSNVEVGSIQVKDAVALICDSYHQLDT